MKTLQIARRFTSAKWGGTETVVLETSRRLRERGHEVEIWSSDALSTNGADKIDGIPVARYAYSYPYLGLSDAARRQLDFKGGNLVSFELYRALRAEPDVDVLHLHTGKRLGGLCRSAAMKRNLPYVVSLHGGVFDVPAEEASSWTEPTRGTFEWGRALGWWFGSRRVLEDADAVVCVGQREAELAAARLPGVRVEYLPNGVEFDHFRVGDGKRFCEAWSIGDDRRLLLVVGRIDRQKNQMEAIELLETLMAEDPRWHLILAGPVTDEDYGQSLRRAVARRGLEQCVTFTGALDPKGDDLRNAYHAADLVLVPSRHEPFGIVVLEAWAAGTPVIASRVGGLAALIEDGRDGFSVPVEDRRGWLQAIRGLSESRPLRAAVAGKASARCRREFDWRVITDRLEGVYESLLTERRLKAPARRVRL